MTTPTPQVILPASGDLAGGVPSYREKAEVDDFLEWQKHRRWLRSIAFFGFGVSCLVFLACLVYALFRILTAGDLPVNALVPAGQALGDTHASILFGLIIVVFAAVPLTLAAGIIKLVSDPSKSGTSDNSEPAFTITTPQFEFLRSLLSAVKSLKGGD